LQVLDLLQVLDFLPAVPACSGKKILPPLQAVPAAGGAGPLRQYPLAVLFY
jgi:hypothetical protein